MREKLSKLNDDWRIATASVTRMGRDDFPAEFSAPRPGVLRRFDSDPGEALYAVDIWRTEAEARAWESDPIVFPSYFSGLTVTLTAYADLLGVPVPALWEFQQLTTVASGLQGEDAWSEWTPATLRLLPAVQRDCARLYWAIRHRAGVRFDADKQNDGGQLDVRGEETGMKSSRKANCDSAAASPENSERPLVEFDRGCSTVRVGREIHELRTYEAGLFLDALIRAASWISSTEMHRDIPGLAGARCDRLKKKLPERLQKAIHGRTGRGYRLEIGLLT